MSLGKLLGGVPGGEVASDGGGDDGERSTSSLPSPLGPGVPARPGLGAPTRVHLSEVKLSARSINRSYRVRPATHVQKRASKSGCSYLLYTNRI